MRGLLLWLAVAFLAVVAEQAANGQGMLVGLRIRKGVEVEVRNHFKSTDVLVGSDSVRLVEGEQ